MTGNRRDRPAARRLVLQRTYKQEGGETGKEAAASGSVCSLTLFRMGDNRTLTNVERQSQKRWVTRYMRALPFLSVLLVMI